jgi:hypothetical protein
MFPLRRLVNRVIGRSWRASSLAVRMNPRKEVYEYPSFLNRVPVVESTTPFLLLDPHNWACGLRRGFVECHSF